MAAFRSTCLLFCATVLCGLAASTRIETDLAAEEAAGAVAPSLALEGSVEEPVDRMVREADPNPGNNKGKGKGKQAKKSKQSYRKKGFRNIKPKRNNKQNKITKKGNKAKNDKRKLRGVRNKGKKPKNRGRGRKDKKEAKKGKKTNKKSSKKTLKKKVNRKKNKNTSGRNQKSGKQTTTSTIALSCLTTAIRLLKFQKDNVANFLTRHARQQKQNALTTKKSGKKGVFAEPAARLVQAGLGDRNNLSCSGSTTSEGAKQLLNITTRLGACQKGIQDACKPPAGINQTFMEQCYNKAMGFNKTLTGCVTTTLTGADACSCFTDAKLVFALTDLKSCKGTAEAKLAAAARNKCLEKVRECNTDLTKAGQLQYSCKITTDEMLKTLAQIMNNNATVTAAMAKVKALTGVGRAGPRMRRAEQPQHRQADQAPEIPDFVARQSGHRVRRQATTAGATTAGATTAGATTTAAPSCGGIITIVTACAAAITNTPAMGDKITEACTITAAKLTCTTAEKVTLQSSVDSVATSQRIFMAFSISIRTELKESSGTTPTAAAVNAVVAALPGNAGATAAAAGRNRNILRKMIMDRMRK